MSINWDSLFDNYGAKKVTKTDKRKKAYVPDKSQRAALHAAGIRPENRTEFRIPVLFDKDVRTVEASYYAAARSEEANRSPEPRMGREFISSWLQKGDVLVLGNIGSKLFAAKLASLPVSEEQVFDELIKRLDKKNLMKKAASAGGQPAKRAIRRDDFIRNRFVINAAIWRSKGLCEMPGCKRKLFRRDDDLPYLEVHHVTPLSEGGDDALSNVAALCPHCHREMHYGKERISQRKLLSAYVSSLK